MKEFRIIFNETELNNVIAFLDRVDFKGLKEVEAINNIMVALRKGEEIKKDK